MLCFDPSKRVTVPEALQHQWLSTYHDPIDEPDCPVKFEKWREIEKLETLEEFREALWKEIESYRREVRSLDIELTALPPYSVKRTTSPVTQDISSPVSPHDKTEAQLPPPTSEGVKEDVQSTSPETTVPNEVSSQEREGSKEREAKDILPDIMSSISPDSHRRSVTTPTDPVVTYARRSSIMQPSRQGSTYNSPLPPSHVPAFVEGTNNSDKIGQGSVAFPTTQGYVVPARSRTGSTVGGEMTRKLLRTLSTVSIHESVERLAGGLAGIAPIGKYITEVNTEADAPPSEVPKDFGMSSEGEDEQTRRDSVKKRFVVG